MFITFLTGENMKKVTETELVTLKYTANNFDE